MKSVVSKSLYSLALATSSLMLVPTVQAAEPGLNLELRTVFFNRDFHDGDPDASAGAQALRLNYTSDYYNDFIGFDASLYGVGKLDGGGNASKLGMLNPDHNFNRGDVHSFGRIGQAYLKMKFGEDTELRAGNMVLATPLLYDDDTRAVPSSTQGVMLTTKLSGVDLYGIYSDRAANMEDNTYGRYRGANGEDYDLYVVGGGYTFANGLGVKVAHGVAEDYLRQSYINLSKPFDLTNGDKFLIDAHYYNESDDGDLYGSDKDSSLFNLAARYTHGPATYTLSYQRIDGDDGYDYSWDGFQRDNNVLMVWNSVQYLDFNSKDEQSVQLRVDYDVAAVPGLSLMARHTEGWGIDNGTSDDLEERETNLEAKYVFQSAKLDGLSMRLRLAHVESEQLADLDAVRFYTNYSFNIF